LGIKNSWESSKEVKILIRVEFFKRECYTIYATGRGEYQMVNLPNQHNERQPGARKA